MTCQEARVFLDAYIDGELDLVRSIEVERHLTDCSGCAAFHDAHRAVQHAVHNDLLRYDPPSALKKQIRRSVAAAERPQRRRFWSWEYFRWPMAVASLSAMVVIAALWLRPHPDPVEREVVDSHVRSLMASHLMDVISTDQHTVKPWFAGKVDFSPPVRDFAAAGFPLTGGRIEYIDRHAAAAIVYHRNQHVINAMVWPVAEPDRGFRDLVEQGYHVIETVNAGMEVWIVSDLNFDELTQFAKLFTSAPSQ